MRRVRTFATRLFLPMRLVFLNQYYPPDAAPTGVMLEGLVQGLLEAGHEVTVLCATGGYAAVEGDVSCQLSVVSDCGCEPRHSVQAPQTTDDSTDLAELAEVNGRRTTDPAALALRRQRGWGDDELVVMYSGNMGLGHRFGEILTVARDRAGEPIRFVFFGGGRRRVEVARFVSENPGCGVELYDYAPAEGLMEHLQSADVHVVSLDVAWTGTMVPSKVQGIFAAGRPVIFIGSAESSIGRWVHESGGGWVVMPDDVTGLLTALEEASDPEIRETRGRAAKAFAEKHFDKTTNVARVAKVLTGNQVEKVARSR